MQRGEPSPRPQAQPGPDCFFRAESGEASAQGWAQTSKTCWGLLRAVYTCPGFPAQTGRKSGSGTLPPAPLADPLSPRDLALFPGPAGQSLGWPLTNNSLGGKTLQKAPAGTTPGDTLVWLPDLPSPQSMHTHMHPPAATSVPGPACLGPASRSGLGTASGRTSARCWRLSPAEQLSVCGGHGWGRVGLGPGGSRGSPNPDGSG